MLVKHYLIIGRKYTLIKKYVLNKNVCLLTRPYGIKSYVLSLIIWGGGGGGGGSPSDILGILQLLLHWTVTCTRHDCSRISNSCVAQRNFMVIYFIP